jgi:folate-binding protein YgfZ
MVISGEDRLAFLQRQTTNDFALLNDSNLLVTILTSPTARILDVFLVFQQEENLICLALPSKTDTTYQYLRKRIFFNDRVSINDTSEAYSQIEIFGTEAYRLFTGSDIQNADSFSKLEMKIAGTPVTVLNPSGVGSLGYRVVIPANQMETWDKWANDHQAKPVDELTYEQMRILAGIPAAGAELSEEYTPLEVGLFKAVSTTKGCYTGQEVIARQITYDKITRRLMGVRIDGLVPGGNRLYVDGAAVGVLTSSIALTETSSLGLGMIKRPYDRENQVVECEVYPQVNAYLVELPFESTE